MTARASIAYGHEGSLPLAMTVNKHPRILRWWMAISCSAATGARGVVQDWWFANIS